MPQDFKITALPDNGTINQKLGLFGNRNGANCLPGITSLTISCTSNDQGWDFEGCPNLASLSYPTLAIMADGCALFLDNNPSLTSVSLPLLMDIQGGSTFVIQNCNALASMSFPSLATVIAITNFTIQNSSSIASISCPSLVSSGNITMSGCSSLTTITLPVFVPTSGRDIDCNSDALNQATVDHILARCVANPAYVAGSVFLQGGTSSAPSAAGLIDKATLIGRGVNVVTN